MEIAVTGIDGSGKTTSICRIVEHLRHLGIEAGYIDLPYFSAVRTVHYVMRDK